MRIAVVFGLALMIAPAVQAQEQSRVVEGCLATLAFGATVEKVEPVVIQDLSALDPPRARISFNAPGTEAPRPFKATCEFENAESPLGLKEYCVEQTCYTADNDARFEEINLLLEQAGF